MRETKTPAREETMEPNLKWHVGGDDILQEWHVVRYLGELSRHQWVMDKDKVRLFTDKSKAQTLADKYNRGG